MAELLILLLFLTAVVTVVGHGIWATLAWLFSGPSGRDRARRRCPFCQNWTPTAQHRCQLCGRDLRSPLATELADLEGLSRQLKRLRDAGVMKSEEVDDLLDRAQQYRRGLLRPSSAEPAVPESVLVSVEVVDEPAKPWPVATRPDGAPREAAPPGGAPATEPATPPPVFPKPVEHAPAEADRPVRPSPKPEPPKPSKPPRMPWTEVLAGFLEERNIRWAELIGVLVGGLLMVGASVALVISLWEKLADVPVFKFFVFVTYSSAVFGAGLFAYWRWKLESTGRGLLAIATLLVPLNFLAMASLSQDDWTLLNVAWETVSLAIFVYLVGFAAGVLVPRGRWFQVGAVVGNSALVLVVARLAGIESDARVFLGAGVLPVAVFAAAVGGFLHRLSDRENLDPGRAGAIFSLLGTAAFALAVAIGLLIARGVRADGVSVTLDRASLLIALAAVPVLAAGMTVVRGMSGDREMGAYRAAGTMIAVLAVTAMLGSLGMAWPQPLSLLGVGGLTLAAMLFVAFRYRMPIAHAGAIASAAVVYLTGYHLWAGNLTWAAGEGAGHEMLRLAASAESGAALVGLFAVLGAAAEVLARWGHRRHSEPYVSGCAVVALVSLALVSTPTLIRGGADTPLAMAVWGIYGVGCLLLNARLQKPLLTYFGLGLLVGATVWGLWWRTERLQQIWATILLLEALAMGLAAAALSRRSGREPGTACSAPRSAPRPNRLVEAYRVPLLHVAEVVAPAGIALGIWTAWLDLGVIHRTATPVVTAVYAAAFYFLLAWGYRSVERTWAGSMIALAGLGHTLVFNYPGRLEQPLLAALLAHATMAVLAGVTLGLWTGRRARERLASDVRRVFIEPLGHTALLSSTLAVPVLAMVSWQETASLAACLFWLAGIWLVIAWSSRWPAMVAASQVVLTLAVVVATTAWLEAHPWDSLARVDLVDPRSLQAYGIGLGLLTLAWTAARILLRRNAVARPLLDPEWPTVDRIVGHAVIGAQLLLAAGCLLPGCLGELTGASPGPIAAALQLRAFGPTAWSLVAVLALALVVALWHRWRDDELAASLLLGATVPCLVAGQFAGEQAAASALRWGLAIGLAASSAAVWQRKRLLAWCARAGGTVCVGEHGPRIGRAVLLATTAGPILLLTTAAALIQTAGVAPGGPAPGSVFEAIGPEVSYLVPLLVLTACLVGFALREVSPGYAFSGGLVVTLTVVLAYLLRVATGGGAIGPAELVTMLQLVAIVAAVWAIAWIAARRWADVWDEAPSPRSGRALMSVQLGMGTLAFGLVWLPAVLALALYPPRWHAWAISAGSPVGWCALLLVVAAVVYRQVHRGRAVPPTVAGLAGMVAIGLLACTVRSLPEIFPGVFPLTPEWGYRTLMLGWGMYALLVVLATWWVATVHTLPDAQGPPQALIRAAAVWVSAAGLLAVLLGLNAAFLHEQPEDLLWAAAAIGLASAASAAMSVWRRREGWAFAAAPGVNLAASLVVWYYQYQLAFHEWWIPLVQANVTASAAVALVWLAARNRLYKLRELSLGTSPLLAAQTALGIAGSACLLAIPVGRLVATPWHLPAWAGQVAEPAGWISLLLAAAAAAWYLRQVAPEGRFHVVGGLGLAVGVLVACSTANLTALTADAPPPDWLAFHVLTACWAAAALVVLAAGMLGREKRRSVAFRPLVQGWVTVIGAAAVALALGYCLHDPGRPWWSARAILAAGLAAGLLATWLRLPGYVYLSGLLLNLTGTVVWMAWESPWTLSGFVDTNVLCLAVGSGVWSMARLAHPDGVPALRLGERRLQFAHLAVQAGLAALGILTVIAVVQDVSGAHRAAVVWHPSADGLGWLALGMVVAAAAILLWDRSARFGVQALYGAALVAVGMALDARGLAPRVFCWTAGPELAGSVLLAAVLGWLAARMRPVWQAAGIPRDRLCEPGAWFSQVQAAVAGLAVLLGAWISIDFAFDGITRPGADWMSGRMAGPLATAALVLAAVFMAERSRARWRAGWQCAAIAQGGLLLAEAAWAWLDPAWFERMGASAWLHRHVILMAAAVVTTFVAAWGLPRLLPAGSDWLASARRTAPALAGLALVLLVVVLGCEVFLFELPGGTPMAIWAIAGVASALAGLAGGGLALALVPGLDPLRMSDRGRTAYVYAAEVLAGLVALHFWLAVPWLFRLGIVEKYWMLMVMAGAVFGAGLSELFHRRGMPVLSEPLERTAVLLPLAPAIVFWLPVTPPGSGFAGASPAFWLLGTLFYGFLGVSKRSPLFSLVALVTGNVGLCVLWQQGRLGFWDYPQLWLIPIGLSALVAEHLNYDRLTRAQSAVLRYFALALIYIPCSAEFLDHLGESPWLPLVLILLSVLGVLAGIVLRIRSFVVLGVTFLVLVIVTMICHAAFAERHIWIFWVFCISLGAAIIALFAAFEKHRETVLAAATRFRQWQRRRVVLPGGRSLDPGDGP